MLIYNEMEEEIKRRAENSVALAAYSDRVSFSDNIEEGRRNGVKPGPVSPGTTPQL